MVLEIDSLDDIDRIGYRPSFEPTVHVNNREDRETVLKTKSLNIPSIATAFSGFQPASLAGRVEDESKIEDQIAPTFEEQLMAIDPEELRAIEKELVEIQNNPPEPNYLIKIQQIVGKMLALHIKMAEKERVQKEDQKSKYTKSNKEWGNYQREVGDRGLNFTWISLGLMALQFVAPESDRQFISYFAKEGCANISNMFNSETQSKQKMVDGISTLAMAEINAMMNKGSSDSSSKQEILTLLEKAYEAQKRAAQAG